MRFYTVEEIANILHITPQTIRSYISEGKIKAIKSGKQYLISNDNFEEYLKKIA
jgi:excisionase family DNA binding protein